MYVFVPSSLSNNKIKSRRESVLGRIKKKKLQIIDKVGPETKAKGENPKNPYNPFRFYFISISFLRQTNFVIAVTSTSLLKVPQNTK